jgi:hypothetical protein|nr:hypothetical protein [uncultured Dongia sp.]
MARFNIRVLLSTALLSLATRAALAQDNPFDKATQVATEWTELARNMVIAGASLAGIAVIALAIAGRLQIGWAFRIIGGLIALSGLSWIVEQAVGGS